MKKLALGLPGGFSISDPSGFAFSGGTIGQIINKTLPYVFGALGFILLFILIWGGFDLLLSGGNPEKVKSGQAKITNALIGFIIAMAAYWIAEIFQIIFNIKILTD